MHHILLHDDKVTVWYLVNNLVIRQMQFVDERCNLSEQASVSGYLRLAVRLDTFFIKTDSLKKFSTDIKE